MRNFAIEISHQCRCKYVLLLLNLATNADVITYVLLLLNLAANADVNTYVLLLLKLATSADQLCI